MNRIIIFANGDLPDIDKARAILRPDDFIMCADGGFRHALALGLKPNLVIGDMDSIDNVMFQQLHEAGIEAELFPRDKNETDLELALRKAIELNPLEIVIVAALGDRLDQTLANISLLSNPRLNQCIVRIDDGVEEAFFCQDQVQIHGGGGDIVSLIPWGYPVRGVQTGNLKWRLDNETLYPEQTRGISNEMMSETATIRIESGLLLVVHRRTS